MFNVLIREVTARLLEVNTKGDLNRMGGNYGGPIMVQLQID